MGGGEFKTLPYCHLEVESGLWDYFKKRKTLGSLDCDGCVCFSVLWSSVLLYFNGIHLNRLTFKSKQKNLPIEVLCFPIWGSLAESTF